MRQKNLLEVRPDFEFLCWVYHCNIPFRAAHDFRCESFIFLEDDSLHA